MVNKQMLFHCTGCFVKGLYLEGAGWNNEMGCLQKSQPKVLIQQLPILKIIPIEFHRLKLQVNIMTNAVLFSFVFAESNLTLA